MEQRREAESGAGRLPADPRNGLKGRRAVWIGLALGWTAALAALAIWIGSTPVVSLRDQLGPAQFWWLESIGALLTLFTAANLRPLRERLGAATRAGVWARVAACCAVALALSAMVAPRTSRIYYDEQIYQGIGQSLSDAHRAAMCHEGAVEYGRLQCQRWEYNKQPNGFPYLLSVGYRVFGADERTGARLNNLCAAFMPLVVFLLTFFLVEDALAASGAALVAALMPQYLLWSNTSASEPSAALFCAVAVLAAAWFRRARTTSALLWMVVATAFAMQFRPECLLVVPVVALVATHGHPEEWRRPRWWAAGLLGLVLCGALIAHFAAVREEPWGADGPRMAWTYVRGNLAVNGWFYFSNERWPAAYTVLAVVGLLFGPRGIGRIALLGYFSLFWGVFLFFYAGSYDFGADVRYSLMSAVPLAALAGIGVAAAARWIDSRFRSLAIPGATVVVAGLLAQFSWFMPLVRAVGEEAWASRADVRVARELSAMLPPNSVVLGHNPPIFLLSGINAAQASLASANPAWVETALRPRYAGGVYFYWNFWCNVPDPVQNRFCTELLANFPHTLIAERRERTYRYALYRLDPP